MNYRILILIDKKNRLSTWYVTKNTLLYNYELQLICLLKKKKKKIRKKNRKNNIYFDDYFIKKWKKKNKKKNKLIYENAIFEDSI